MDTSRDQETEHAALAVKGLSVHFGAVKALSDLTLDIAPGEAVAVLGANGAGKTTLLRALTGLQRLTAGSVALHGKQVSGVATHTVAGRGLRLVPEGRQVFARLTVDENLTIGGYTRLTARPRESVEETRAEMMQRFPLLKRRAQTKAGNLSGGEQQMLALARALMSRPSVLLLDEPSTGLAPLIVDQIFDVFEELRSEALTIVLVEQIARKALMWADRAYVLQLGSVVLAGRADEVASDPRLEAAYLGVARTESNP